MATLTFAGGSKKKLQDTITTVTVSDRGDTDGIVSLAFDLSGTNALSADLASKGLPPRDATMNFRFDADGGCISVTTGSFIRAALATAGGKTVDASPPNMAAPAATSAAAFGKDPTPALGVAALDALRSTTPASASHDWQTGPGGSPVSSRSDPPVPQATLVARTDGQGAKAVSNAAPTADEETTYLSGVLANGTVAATSYWTWKQTSSGYASSGPVDKWGSSRLAGTSGGTETYWFQASSNFTAAEKLGFEEGLAIWSAEANISFAPATSEAAAGLEFIRGGSSDGTSEVPPNPQSVPVGGTMLGTQGSGVVIIFQTSPDYYGKPGSFTDSGGYGMQCTVHEEGHFLGLGHGGPYNGNVQASTDQYSAEDNRDFTVMSYIEASDSSAKYYSQYTVKGTFLNGNYATTPMMLDILAAQRLYGAPTSTPLSGGQVFGFNTNITGLVRSFFDFTVNVNPVLTLFDTGTGNTLDLSGYSTAETVDLNPGSFSSFDGMVNNMAIATSTSIDAVIGGAGNDTFTVNADADTIDGGGGTNTVVFAGAQTAYTLARSGGTVTVTRKSNGIADTLSNIATLDFADASVSTVNIACFLAGTRILTCRGGVSVEDLHTGQQVVTRDGRLRPIVWIGHRSIDVARHTMPARVFPVRILAGAFADGAPSRDLFLSPDHAVLCDGVLVPAHLLVNGTSIRRAPMPHVRYFHIELDAHDIVLADGLAVESWLDTGNRAMFANAPVSDLRPTFTDAATAWSHSACAPLVTEGPALAAIRAALAKRLRASWTGPMSAGRTGTDPA